MQNTFIIKYLSNCYKVIAFSKCTFTFNFINKLEKCNIFLEKSFFVFSVYHELSYFRLTNIVCGVDFS